MNDNNKGEMLMKYLMLFILPLMLACAPILNDDGPAPAPSPSPTASGEPGHIVQPSPTPSPEKLTFEGYSIFQNGGYADCVEDAQGMFTFRSLRITVKNADGTWAVVPLTSTSALAMQGGSLYLTQSVTYSYATHGVKDNAGNALNAAYTTQFRFFKAGGLLYVSVKITSPATVLLDTMTTP